jgi:uncharacterized protein (TIGR02145 family)
MKINYLILTTLMLFTINSNAQVLPFGFISSESTPIIEEVTVEGTVWSKKNLDVTTYRDGTTIPQITNSTDWAGATSGAWTYWGFTVTDEAGRGKYYNGYAIEDSRGLSPSGWHIPTETEARNFIATVNVTDLRDITTWTDGLGADRYGFGLKKAGRVNSSGSWADTGNLTTGEYTELWTSYNNGRLYFMSFKSAQSVIILTRGSTSYNNFGYGVRLIKD